MSYINKTSGYWLGTDLEDKYYDPITGEYNKPTGKDLFALSGYRRAIANFVRIVTAQDIPVEFRGDDSYTDGKRVVLSGNIKSGNFDVAVGLALHEGSHIKLTDFTHLRNGIGNYVPQELKDKFVAKGLTEYHAVDVVKNMLNVVEDRRIDHFIMTTAQGYRGYYEAMYDYYFNAKIIDKALQTQQWSEKTLEHYMNHIINFINPNRTLDLLPGLRTIWNTLNLKNISRLKSTEDALTVALEMATILVANIDKIENEEDENTEGSGGDGENKEMTLKDKIGEHLETLGKAIKKMEMDDPRMPKVFDQVKYYTELWDELQK
jgi:hypothetical protein